MFSVYSVHIQMNLDTVLNVYIFTMFFNAKSLSQHDIDVDLNVKCRHPADLLVITTIFTHTFKKNAFALL